MGTSASFETHPVRGRFNAGFFTVLDRYINWLVRDKKRKVFSALPREVVEIGPGVGANFAYMPTGGRVIAIEPNPYMHGGLLSRAARRGIDVEICSVAGDAIDLDDQSVDAVISSLAAGFASVEIDQYCLRSPFLPANTAIAGTAIA
jgi:hypothetical protein